MVTRAVVSRPKDRQMARAYHAPANLTERCLLSVIGILAAFMTLVHGMLTMSALPPLNVKQDIEVYWTIATLGIWVPAICLFCSILGVMIQGKATVAMLVLSPIISIGAYCLYTYVAIEPFLMQLAVGH